MILYLFGKEWIVVNEEVAIYLSFLIVLTILINNLGGTVVTSFTEQKNQAFINLRRIITAMTILSVLVAIIYMLIVNYDGLKEIQQKILIRYLLFNIIFLLNIVVLMSPTTSKLWFLIYGLQISWGIYSIRYMFSIYKIEDLICLYCIIYCLGLFGYLFFIKITKILGKRYAQGVVKQNNFYEKILPKHRLLNIIFFFRNIIITRLGSHEIPENPSKSFWLMHSILLFFMMLVTLNNSFKLLFGFGLLCLVISARYDTICHNYKDSIGFKKNFNLNARYWSIRIGKKEQTGGLITRKYCTVARETLKVAFDKVAYTHTNPRLRTVVTIGGCFIIVGGLSVWGYTKGEEIRQQGALRIEETKQQGALKIEETKQHGLTNRHKMEIDDQQNARDHEYRMKALDSEKKRLGLSGWFTRK